jgi:hypothetical protein
VSLGRGDSGEGIRDSGRDDLPPPSPRPAGDPVLPKADDEVVLAFGAPAVSILLEVDAEPKSLDVQFSVDTTGSIGGEIDELQRDLEHTVIPELDKRIFSVAFGVSAFQDFPLPPFGTPGGTRGVAADVPFRLFEGITSKLGNVITAVGKLDQPLGAGGDVPESGAEALWQIATGEGYALDGIDIIEPYSGRVGGGKLGGVGFREGSLRVVLHITDAPSHGPDDYAGSFPGTHSVQEAGEALAAIGCKVIGIVTTGCGDGPPGADCDSPVYQRARGDLEEVAVLTGAVGPENKAGRCAHGVDGKEMLSVDGACPLVFDVAPDGTGLSNTLLDAVTELVDGIRFSTVSAAVGDDPIGFVERVVPSAVRQSADTVPAMIEDRLPKGSPDGEPDSFVAVHASTRLAFEVSLRNLRIAPTDVEQHFRVVVRVLGDDVLVDERTIRVTVPRGDKLAPRVSADAAAPDGNAAGTGDDAGNG